MTMRLGRRRRRRGGKFSGNDNRLAEKKETSLDSSHARATRKNSMETGGCHKYKALVAAMVNILAGERTMMTMIFITKRLFARVPSRDLAFYFTLTASLFLVVRSTTFHKLTLRLGRRCFGRQEISWVIDFKRFKFKSVQRWFSISRECAEITSKSYCLCKHKIKILFSSLSSNLKLTFCLIKFPIKTFGSFPNIFSLRIKTVQAFLDNLMLKKNKERSQEKRLIRWQWLR